MNSNSGSQINNHSFKDKLNLKDETGMSNINQSELLIFLQFYFTNAQKNLINILSDKIIKNDNEIHKITSSFNFWLNFSLNFKDPSFVSLLLNEKDERAIFSKKKLKEILTLIVKFLYDNLNSEEAYNKNMKNNHSKLYELILKFKDIIDNVYNSNLRNEMFINVVEDNQSCKDEIEDKNEKEVPASWFNQKILEDKNGNLIMPQMVENINNDIKQFNNNINFENAKNIMINNINNITNNNKESQINENNNDKNIDNNKEENEKKEMQLNNNNENNNNNSNKINSQEINNNNISSNNENNNSILPYKVSSPCLDYVEIRKLFTNFCYFTKFNLQYFQMVFYEKIGYAFLNYNGDFMWADEYTTYILFEEENIKKINLFNIMTDFSKYILKKKYKDHFFDFKDPANRLRVFTYTVDGPKNKEKKGEKLFEDLCKIKTLVSRASPVLLNGQEGTYIACIFLETKFSLYRQNFDFFYWKSDWNSNK